MKNLLIITGVLMAMFATIGSASAMGNGQGQGQGTANGEGSSQCLDANENEICDGQEDEDEDGILNKDEEDFEKQNMNMNDEDGDGVSNKDDEDFERPDDDGDGIANRDDEDYEGQVGTGNQNMNNASGTGNMNMNNGTGIANQDGNLSRGERKNELKGKMGRNGSMVEGFINGYLDKVGQLTEEEQQSKLEKLISKIDIATAKIEQMPEGEKKELYMNVLEYFQLSAEENLETIE